MLSHKIKKILSSINMDGAVSSQEVVGSLNEFCLNNLLSDLAPFALRKSITFSSKNRNDCYTPSKFSSNRLVSQIKGKISDLKFSLDKYTTNWIYDDISNAQILNPQFQSYWSSLSSSSSYNLEAFTVQRENVFNSSGREQEIAQGTVNQNRQFHYKDWDIGRLSSYWTSIKIFNNYDQRIITEVVFKEVSSSSVQESSGFSFYFDAISKEIVVQKTRNPFPIGQSVEDFTVKIYTFVNQGAILVKNNKIYVPNYTYNYSSTTSNMKSDILLDCYVCPRLVYSENDSLDPILRTIERILLLGTAKNIAMFYASNKDQNTLLGLYSSELRAYVYSERKKDNRWRKNTTVDYEPLTYSANCFSIGGLGYGF